MSESDLIKRLTTTVEAINQIWEGRLEHPQTFISPNNFDDVNELVVAAQIAAANREFMGETVARARRLFGAAEAMLYGLEWDLTVEFDRALVDDGQRYIATGWAWREREAQANLSVLDRRVEFRGAELRIKDAKSKVKEVEDVFQAWRDTEWALDRQARLLSLRHALGEV